MGITVHLVQPLHTLYTQDTTGALFLHLPPRAHIVARMQCVLLKPKSAHDPLMVHLREKASVLIITYKAPPSPHLLPLSPSHNPLQPCWPPHCPSHTPSMLQPQGLCSSTSLCLEHSSLDSHTAHSPASFGQILTCHFVRGLFQPPSLKAANPLPRSSALISLHRASHHLMCHTFVLLLSSPPDQVFV